MAPRGDFFDYDPITGVTEFYEEVDGKGHIHSYQDVEPIIDAAQRFRNEGGPDEAWKKQGATMYASLPMIVVADMLKRGINVFDQNDMPKVIAEINTTYSKFKTTYKNHALK
jgi:hypothetical protein